MPFPGPTGLSGIPSRAAYSRFMSAAPPALTRQRVRVRADDFSKPFVLREKNDVISRKHIHEAPRALADKQFFHP